VKHVIIVKLEIETATWADACEAVEHVLDLGTFQDEINYQLADDVDDEDRPVLSATCDAESGFANAYRREAYEKAIKAVAHEATDAVKKHVTMLGIPNDIAAEGGRATGLEEAISIIHALKDKL
jgi:hypothetical protein